MTLLMQIRIYQITPMFKNNQPAADDTDQFLFFCFKCETVNQSLHPSLVDDCKRLC